ncbi:MAG: serine/threonine-protein kinase [Pseudomonadota bacterium]
MARSQMTQFSQQLGAYLSGKISLQTLEQTIDAIAEAGDDVDSALSMIEMQRDSGRLAAAIHETLARRLRGQASAPEPTAPLPSTRQPSETTEALRSATANTDATLPLQMDPVRDEKTQALNPGAEPLDSSASVSEGTLPLADSPHAADKTEPVSSDNAPTEFQPTQKINQHVDATEVINSHVAPTVQINQHVGETQQINRHVDATEVINNAPEQSNDATQNINETPFPSLPLPTGTGTGSNWLNPEQWTQRRSGPVETGVVLKRRFLIEEQLGRGGMGAVFKARDKRKDEAQDRDPHVAIKVLNKSFQEHPQALIALQREARKAQTLAHPNIVTVYDFDRDGTTVYMTMELMRGEPLDKIVRRHKDVGLDPEIARAIIEQMAEGLAYAHEKRIIHSDFKPGNVFLTEDNRVKVLDFGIARAAAFQGQDSGEKTVFDAGDLRSLTPAYASVEMFDGDEPHPADDVYGLAVTAYILLTGRHPFDRKTAQQAQELNLEPEPIASLAKHEWQAIAHGLAFEREARSQDAAEFLAEFRGRQQRVQRWALAAIAGLAALAIFFAVQSTQPKGPAIPWQELTPQQQVQFNEYVSSGREWLANDPPWIGGAYTDFAAAFDIHPDNPEATKGLDEVADALIALNREATNPEAQRRLLNDIQTASTNPYLAEHSALRRVRRQLERAIDQSL